MNIFKIFRHAYIGWTIAGILMASHLLSLPHYIFEHGENQTVPKSTMQVVHGLIVDPRDSLEVMHSAVGCMVSPAIPIKAPQIGDAILRQVRSGDDINSGEIIAILSSRSYESNFVTLARAHDEAVKNRQIANSAGVVSSSDAVQKASVYEREIATISEKIHNLNASASDLYIRAPFDGSFATLPSVFVGVKMNREEQIGLFSPADGSYIEVALDELNLNGEDIVGVPAYHEMTNEEVGVVSGVKLVAKPNGRVVKVAKIEKNPTSETSVRYFDNVRHSQHLPIYVKTVHEPKPGQLLYEIPEDVYKKPYDHGVSFWTVSYKEDSGMFDEKGDIGVKQFNIDDCNILGYGKNGTTCVCLPDLSDHKKENTLGLLFLKNIADNENIKLYIPFYGYSKTFVSFIDYIAYMRAREDSYSTTGYEDRELDD